VEQELNGEAAPTVPTPATPTMVPRLHQTTAVAAIAAAARAKHRGFLLADDVGLGKTVSAWQSVLEMPAVSTVLIVCPLAVVAHWRRTLLAMGDGGREVVILNYERVGKLFEVAPDRRSKIKSKKGLARFGQAPAVDVVIWDESHRCKNPVAARSKLAAKLNATAGFVLWLSATAGQNPLELSYLAPVLARVTGNKPGDLKDFEQWCLAQGLGVKRGAYGRWEWSGEAADCEKVRVMLFDGKIPAGLRRRPEEIAGWPAINRILTPIELDPTERDLYDQAWTEFRAEMDLDARGHNPTSALTRMLRFRQKSSLLRAAGTARLALELLENGHQVAVSVAFLETLDRLHDAFVAELGEGSCALIHGQLSSADKEDERLRFQRGDAKVVLFTVEEGISLHQGELLGPGEFGSDAPRSELIHDLRWSAIQMAQIEGRCHRDGRFAQVYWAYADDTIEERIATLVSGRIQSMKAMVGDDVDTIRQIEELLREGAGPE
jgi:primosomal protein N'